MSRRKTPARGRKKVIVITEDDINGIDPLSLPPQRAPKTAKDKKFKQQIEDEFEFYCANRAVGPLISTLRVITQRTNKLVIQVTKDMIIFQIPPRDQATIDIVAVIYRTSFDIYHFDPTNFGDASDDLEPGDYVAREYIIDSSAVKDACDGFQTKAGENVLTLCVRKRDWKRPNLETESSEESNEYNEYTDMESISDDIDSYEPDTDGDDIDGENGDGENDDGESVDVNGNSDDTTGGESNDLDETGELFDYELEESEPQWSFMIHNWVTKPDIKFVHPCKIESAEQVVLRKFIEYGDTSPGLYSIAMTMDVAKNIFTKVTRDQKSLATLLFTPTRLELVRTRGQTMGSGIPVTSHKQCAYRSVGDRPVKIENITQSDIIIHNKYMSNVKSIWISEPEPEDECLDELGEPLTIRTSRVRCRYNLINDQGFVLYEQWI